MNKKNIIIIVLLLSLNSVFSQDMDKRVEGLSTFLVEKENENYLYTFEEKLTSNKLLKEFFPGIQSLASTGNIQTLILNSDLWDRTIESDLNTLITKTLLSHTENVYANISKLISNQNIDKIFITAKETSVIIETISYPISNSSPSSVKEEISLIYEPIVNLYEANSEFKEMLIDTEIDLENVTSYERLIDDIILILTTLNERHNSLIDLLDTVKLSDSTLKTLIRKNSKILENQIDTFANLLEIYNELDISSFRYLSSTVKVIEITEFLEKTLSLNGKNISKLNFNKFRTLVLVFTQIEDASTGEEVNLILSKAVLPPLGFRVKRDNSVHFIINSYLGYWATTEYEHGLTAMLNMEVSYGLGNLGSISLFISPIDLLNPVNLFILGEKEELEYQDLAVLSYGITFGLDKVPFAFGAAYSYDENKTVLDSIRFFAGFDMPLYTIF